MDYKQDPYIEPFLKQIPAEQHEVFMKKLVLLVEEYQINKDGPDITLKSIPKIWYGKKKSAYDDQMNKHLQAIADLNKTMPAFMQETIREAVTGINEARAEVEKYAGENESFICRTKDDLYYAIKEMALTFGADINQISIRDFLAHRV